MTIGMQGLWSVSVKGKHAAWPQRFKIEGSSNGVDGVYDESSAPILVTGPQWGITIEHNPPGPESWRQSRQRLANSHISSGQFLFDIETDDYGVAGTGDKDFNDLILTCAMPLSTTDYVVYGQVKSYSGRCLFNPCFPPPYVVIDYPWQLEKLLEYKPMRKIIEKLYPERVKEYERVPPFPLPDPPPFRPMMIPTGLPEAVGVNVQRSANVKAVSDTKKPGKNAVANVAKAAGTTALSFSPARVAGKTLLDSYDLLLLARLRDRLELRPCMVKPVGQTLMRFSEYDRTVAEKLGDPYSGEGNRHVLGVTATDDYGNYVFRFSQDYNQVLEEVNDRAEGEDPLTELRPDLLIALMASMPDGVLYETPPYYNIANVKQINLCLPSSELELPRTSCQGGRAIQALGNLSIITSGTTLEDDGTVTNTNVSGPIVDHAAWYNRVDLFACFLDTDPRVEYYTLRYRCQTDTGWTEWDFVNQTYKHPKQQGDGTWKNEKIGPLPKALRVDGPADPKVPGRAYLNVEDQITKSEWQNTKRDRKLILTTSIYQSGAGAVEFMIQGYDASGEKVPDAVDIVKLYIDNNRSDGEIDYVKLGADDPGDCAYFELPSAAEPLTVRYKVTDVEGFMLSYRLKVYRGSNTPVATVNQATGSPVKGTYEAVAPYRYGGTLDETIDPSGYVEIDLQPLGGSWLPGTVPFCAFSFELSATDRKTNGYGTPGNMILFRELVGISYTLPGSESASDAP